MRPRRVQRDHIAFRQWRNRQRFGALHRGLELDVELEHRAFGRRGEHRVQAASATVTQSLVEFAWRSGDVQRWHADQAAHVADSNAESRLTDLARRRRIVIAGDLHAEDRTLGRVEFEHAYLVQPAHPRQRAQRPAGVQRLGEEDPRAGCDLFDRSRDTARVGLHHHDAIAVRHEQDWPGQRLGAGGATCDLLHRLRSILLPVRDGATDHRDRDHQGDGHAEDHQDLDRQSHTASGGVPEAVSARHAV